VTLQLIQNDVDDGAFNYLLFEAITLELATAGASKAFRLGKLAHGATLYDDAIEGGFEAVRHSGVDGRFVTKSGTGLGLKRNTEFIEGATVVDRRTGKIFNGTVDLRPTLDRIAAGRSFPHRNDGSIFQNRPFRGTRTPGLPVKPGGYYREFVHPTPGVSGPGPQRIIVGQGGEIYYTPDHYRTFFDLYP
jgi:filamentous hemagglutinin